VTRRQEWQGHWGDVLDSVGGFDVIECGACGFKHIVPIPTSEELDQIYRQDYYSTEKPLYLERHREDLEWWDTFYADHYDRFETALPPDRRRLLDVGSGPGFFLLHGKRRGWDVLGVDPSAQAVAHARGLGVEVVEGFLTDETADQFGIFDVIHMNEVLEHIPDPRAMVRLARALLRPGGLLCVIVPNDYNPLQAIVRDQQGYEPWWVAPPHHINYFDAGSLARLVEDAGLEVEETTGTFPMELFLLMGDDYVGDDAVGRAMHAKRKRMELSVARAGATGLKREVYSALARMGIGRAVVIHARRGT
jgi:SAM-dependent methyltransferase